MPKRSRKRPPQSPFDRHTKPQVGRVIVTVLTATLAGAAGYYFLDPPEKTPQQITAKTERFTAGRDAGYVDSTACAGCHAEIAETYRQTGMGRSFARATPENMIEDFSQARTYQHEASKSSYEVFERGGKYFQKRSQRDSKGSEVNVFEQEIHYVMGSGNHARSYLHHHPNGKITEMPLGWYAANGGFWAMSPGYDQPHHRGFSREISFECMGCHNSYPAIAPGEDCAGCDPLFRGKIPEGIDCQRCHGPGQKHIDAVAAASTAEKIRESIVNPARLSVERQLETCMQCHLESTSRRLPYALPRFGKGAFSYAPGEPLGEHVIHFDHAAGQGPQDKFEIAHAAYRLRKSACFQQAEMTCTTCHDPHHIERVDAAVCRDCHGAEFNEQVAAGRHTSEVNCIDCHMPKRRSDDVVHVVMTDHYIQRRKPSRDLLAPLREIVETPQNAYRGEVALYYPPELAATPENDLMLAVAQVSQQSNLKAGITQLERLIEQHKPGEAHFYYELAEALWSDSQSERAFAYYQKALEINPRHLIALRNYGAALSEAGRIDEAARVLDLAPGDAKALSNRGEVFLKQGRPREAEEILRRALASDPLLPETHNNLATALARLGDLKAAIAAAREAVRIRPDYAPAHNNLGNYLFDSGDAAAAEQHYREALAANADYAEAAYNYASLLTGANRTVEAENLLRRAIKASPRFAMAHNNLGNLLAMSGRVDEAIGRFREAVKADSALAEPRFNLGTALASEGRLDEAVEQLRAALRLDPDYVQAKMNLAFVLADLGSEQEAKALFEQLAAGSDEKVTEMARRGLELLEKR